MESIISTERKCYICKAVRGLELHHIFYGTAYRRKSEEDGLTCYLCHEHHQGYTGVHGYDGYDLNTSLKREAEKKWLKHYGKTVEDFIARYGKNYL